MSLLTSHCIATPFFITDLSSFFAIESKKDDLLFYAGLLTPPLGFKLPF